MDDLPLDSEKLRGLLNGLLDKLKEQRFCPSNKKYNNLLDLIDDLDSNQYLWLRNEDNFKNILGCFCFFENELAENKDDRSTAEKGESLVSNFPSLETKLDDVHFDSEFDKLILKIRNGGINGPKVGGKLSDIIGLTKTDLLKIPGIGKKYFHLFETLKNNYEKHPNAQKSEKIYEIREHDFDFDGMAIRYSSLSESEKRHVKKYFQYKKSCNIYNLVKFDRFEFHRVEGVGKQSISAILGVQARLQSELENISTGDLDYVNMESELILSTRLKEVPIEEIDTILLEDIDNFLDRATEDEQDIFQSRWGFVEPESTLEEIGLKHNLTRERIRQKESKTNNKLIQSMRLTQENIWFNLKENINLALSIKLENLSTCFDNEKNFYRFLGYVCGGKNIEKMIRPDIQEDMLNIFFTKNGTPCDIFQVKSYIQEDYFLDSSYANNILDYLEELGSIQIIEGKVYPRFLKKNEAAACILCDHPQGLPWLDVAKIVNVKNISRTNLNETRLDNQALFDSDFTYLAGKGVYKNTKHMNLSEINMDLMFESLLIFFDKTNRDVFHLNEAYHKSDLLKKYDYYIVRYIVKMYGEDYGFYFQGKSQTDSVGLKKDFKNITQKEVILEAMNTNKKPMTKAEIANLLKSNSLGHASYYLEVMTNDEQIVQVDRMLYTTPNIAYAEIDLPTYIKEISNILFSEKRPVDPSIFQYEINRKLSVSYSKHFYSSIAKRYSQENDWYRKKNLYSLSEIKYKNLTDAISVHCKIELDSSSNYERLHNFIAITRESAHTTIHNWQSSIRINEGVKS